MSGYEIRYSDRSPIPGVHHETCFARRQDAEATIASLEADPIMGEDWQAGHLYVDVCSWGERCTTTQ